MASNSRLILDGIDTNKLAEISAECDKLSNTITALVRNIVNSPTEELDALMDQIYKRFMNESSGEVTLPELEDFLAELCAVMYRTQMSVEKIGILADTSKNIYEDVYANAVRNSDGTAKDKREADGMLKAQYEALCLDVRKRAYNIAKLKMEGADRQMTAIKKIITSRISEFNASVNDGTDN
ncbi:MAG: hypothetical protein LBP62_05685 [Clostridiales bacterium]|jgi:Fe2+ transport system protein B|nr:hypothetical protein [Clostridiales bacterium]